ncbi:ATP-dependent DNA ligase [Streptomyces sp. NPDC001970]
MLAVIGPPPRPETEAEYAHETLFGGARVIAHLPGDGSLRLLSQAGMDVTAQYPELEALSGLLPGPQAVLDGEIITLDSVGRPSVERLQQRMSLHHSEAVTHALEDPPVRLMIYDSLHLGEPTVQLPHTARRDLLDDLPDWCRHHGARGLARTRRPGHGTERQRGLRRRRRQHPAPTCPAAAPATGSRSSTWGRRGSSPRGLPAP